MKWALPLNEICEYGEDAGTYVCNFSMWVCNEWAAMHSAHSAFLHIPATFDVPMAAEYVKWVIAEVKRGEQENAADGEPPQI
jgi:pyrrolidone-carboxylate peptidase